MAEAADFSMPDVFANAYLDRIMKKTEKSLNNTCILYQYSKRMADKDESTSDAVTIDTNPGNVLAHTPLPLSEPQILSTAKT
jgi:hypothetical protein